MRRLSDQIYPLPSGKRKASFCRWFGLNSKTFCLRTELCTKCCEGQKEEKLNEEKQLHPSPQQDAGSDKRLGEAHPKGCWSTEDGEIGSPHWSMTSWANTAGAADTRTKTKKGLLHVAARRSPLAVARALLPEAVRTSLTGEMREGE